MGRLHMQSVAIEKVEQNTSHMLHGYYDRAHFLYQMWTHMLPVKEVEHTLPVPDVDHMLPVKEVEHTLPVPDVDHMLPVKEVEHTLPVPDVVLTLYETELTMHLQYKKHMPLHRK